MADVFDAYIQNLLEHEGGYSNNPADAGGETNWGITLRVARENGYAGSMAVMTRDSAIAIYRAIYWIKSGFAQIATASPTLATKLLDAGVNIGVGTVSEFLQRSLNALNEGGKDYPDIAVDGSAGPGTLAAVQGLITRRGWDGTSVLIKAVNCLQGARYIALAESRAQNEAFEFGWLANRIA